MGKGSASAGRFVTPEPLNVAPGLVGLPLAAPLRRAGAMSLDLLLLALLSGVEGFWLWAGLALVVLQLRNRQRAANPSGRRQWVGWLGAALLAALALGEAWSTFQAHRHPEWRAEQRPSAAATDSSADDEDGSPAAPSATAASRPAARAASSPASSASAIWTATWQDARIADLERQLAAAKKHQPMTPRGLLNQLLEAIGASFGWGVVYFSLLPAWWGGQTVGKKLFGLKVVELTGKPMTVMLSLRRYGGYAAGLATGGLGFAGVVWDVNRQALHDKAAHTVVVDVRGRPEVESVAMADAPRIGHRFDHDR